MVTIDSIDAAWDELSARMDYASLLVSNSCENDMLELSIESANEQVRECIMMTAAYVIQTRAEKGELTIN
jgi:hypothetical protein